MRKEELRSMKRIYAMPKMVRMARENNKKMEYKSQWGNRQKILPTEYDLFVRCQTRGRILMVCIFRPEMLAAGIITPVYEIYCNPEGDEYITRIMKERDGTEEKWSMAMFDNLWHVTNSHLTDYEMKREDSIRRIWQNPEGKKTIQGFLKTKKKGVEGLIEWQRKVKAQKIAEAEARQKAPWDADMKLVPRIMPSFKGWMQREAADRYFIIYEYKGREPEEGWCSGCRRYVPVVRPRHNKKGKCPKCGKDITYKTAGRIRTLSTGRYDAQCIQRIDGGIVVREFRQYQYYRDTVYTDPHVITSETKRVLVMDDGTVKRYVYGLYKNRENRFIPDRYGYTRHYQTKVYTGNIAALKKTVLKNSAIDLWMKHSEKKALPAGAMDYMAIEKRNPAIEKLVRIGMFRLAEELIHISYQETHHLVDQEATELARMIRIDKARLKRLKAMDGGISHLLWLQYEKRADRVWPDEMIKDFGDNGIEGKDFGFLKPPPGYVRLWHYMRRQQALTGDSLAHIRTTWEDYINMAGKAKMDVTNERIWKPKDLKDAHAGVILLLQKGEMEKEAARLEKKWPKVNGILPRLRKFEYADKRFAIVAPESILDIVKEGRILQHCVHTCDFYFDRIQKDETYLFFLRRAGQETTPWYTLEVEAGGNIRQKRTTGDNQNKDFREAMPFLKKWQKYFVQRMTEEEKELGKKAEQARIEEYEKLRKDGNKVWHGKLAGKLLADVLEADFMAAAT